MLINQIMKTNFFTLIVIIVSLCSCKKDNSSDTLNIGLVAYYPFNGNANDESGHGNNGIVFGATLTTDRFGIPNKAYLLNGIDNYIKVQSPIGLNNPNFSYSIWLKILQLPPSNTCNFLMELGYPYMESIALAINNNYPLNNQTTGWSANSPTMSNSGINFQTGNLPDINVWYNILIVKNDTSVCIFENNNLLKQVMTNGANTYYTSPIDLYFGARALLWPNFFFNGVIDDIRIYNRALTGIEIKELQNLKQ